MRGIIIRTLERQNVDQFEINAEEREVLNETDIRRGNLQIQRVNTLNVHDDVDNINSNRNISINNNRINEQNQMYINLQNNNNNNLNELQNNQNQNLISSTGSEINYNKNININKGPYMHEKENSDIINIRHKYNLGEIDKEIPRRSWNEVNNIQQTAKLFIYQKRDSGSYLRESNKSSWNEKNRQQGIVNLSVIDDNKKKEEKKDENINLMGDKNNLGINFNDRNLQGSTRPIRNINNDYDSDGLDINNINNANININKTYKISEKKEDIKESKKEDNKVEKRDSQDSKKSKKSSLSKSGNNKIIIQKKSPKAQQINQQYISNQSGQSIHTSKRSSKDANSNINYNINNQQNLNINKIQSPALKISGKSGIQPGEKSINRVLIDLSDDKKSQQKSSGLTYMIEGKSSEKGDSNNKNINISSNADKRSYQYSMNYPKPKATYERDSNIRYVSQSQPLVATGKMKKKSKVKKFEYLREPNQSQNFQ
jgi:hypothetical protein